LGEGGPWGKGTNLREAFVGKNRSKGSGATKKARKGVRTTIGEGWKRNVLEKTSNDASPSSGAIGKGERGRADKEKYYDACKRRNPNTEGRSDEGSGNCGRSDFRKGTHLKKK